MQQFINDHYTLLSIAGICFCIATAFVLGWNNTMPRKKFVAKMKNPPCPPLRKGDIKNEIKHQPLIHSTLITSVPTHISINMKKRTLQIDVKGFHEESNELVIFNLIVDGRTCQCYTSRSNYEALMYDGFFIRDGKEKDSANVLNTTHVFEER